MCQLDAALPTQSQLFTKQPSRDGKRILFVTVFSGICLLVCASESTVAQIRLNLGSGKSGIAVGPGGSGVIGQFNRSGGFQGIGVGQPQNIRVYPGNSSSRQGIRVGTGSSGGIAVGSGRNGTIAIGSGSNGGVAVGVGGNVGVVVTNPPRYTKPQPGPRPIVCPPNFTQPPHYVNPVSSGAPRVEVSTGRVVVDTNYSAASGVARIKTLMRSGQTDQAADLASALVEKYGDNAEVLHAYSLTRFARAEFDDAAASNYDAVSIKVEWNWTEVRQYFAAHDAYLAPLKQLQTAASQNPESASLRFLLSSHYIMLGATNQARTSLRRTDDLMPEDPVVASLKNQLPPTLAIAE